MVANLDDLKRKRFASLVSSKHAIRQHPEEYRELRRLVQSVLCEPLDTSKYTKTASRLALLLREMTGNSPESVFSYFYRNIDPAQYGEIRYFRATCIDLYDQMHHIDQFRIGERKMRLVK